ncbi:MAG TPA: alpha/beta fold hydrolase [Aquabacterium sp.]|nr:alpha/beta fold hydrolase [Aquabacterium sp.]
MKHPTQRIFVNGVGLNVLDTGQGIPVLLVHGFPDDHEVWRHQIDALVKAGYRVIAPDTRGCGESDIPKNVKDFHIDTLVADLIALLDVLKLPSVRLIGHDWGAAICWRLCMLHPERIERYVALSVGHLTAYARGPLEQKLKGWYVLFFQLRGVAEAIIKAGNWRLLRAFTGLPSEVERWIRQLSRPGRLTAGLNYYRANMGLIIPRRLPHVKVPVLGIYSTGDRFLAEAQMTDSAHYVDAAWQYQRVKGASHWLQLDAPDTINTLLIQYLGSDQGHAG